MTMVDSQLNRQLEAKPEQPPAIEQPVSAVKSPARRVAEAEKGLKDIYFVSGLGADERVFRLLKFEGYQPVHLRWVDPERGETMEHYAQRLATQITSSDPVLVGLSFGGMVAVEIAKQIPVERVILISSAKTAAEIPPYFKLFRWFPIHRIFPFKTLLWAGYWIAYWFFSLETIDERKLLKAILWDTDAHFLKWALHRVVTWRNETVPEHLYHIHGTSDRIFPISYVEADYVLEPGGHFMIINKAGQISTLIERIMGMLP